MSEDPRDQSDLHRVQRALDGLPAQYRHIFVLRRVHGRSVVEIAAETGLPAETVERHLGTAILLVARILWGVEPDGKEAALDFARHLGEVSTDPQPESAADQRLSAAYARMAAVWDIAAGLHALPPTPDHDEARSAAGGPPRAGQDQQ